MKTRPKYDLRVKKGKIKAGKSCQKGTDTGVKMKTEHSQPALRSLSGHSTGKEDTAVTNRLRNTITLKKLGKMA